MKKILCLFICILLFSSSANCQQVYDDSYTEHPNYIEGKKYLSNSQYSSAINEFKKAIRVNPLDTSALIELVNAYNMRATYYNNTVKAVDNAILDLKSALFFAKYYNINTQIITPQNITAIEKNLNSISKNITEDERLRLAKISRTKGEFAASAYDYFQIINTPKYITEANIALGDIFKILNRPERALSHYRNAQISEPSNTDINLKLARTYEQLNDFPASLNEYSKALDSSNEREEILNSLERIWQKKVDENPKDAEAHSNLGVVYQKQKRYAEAMEEYQKAEVLNPKNINTKINIGTLYQEQKKYDAALNSYNSILQLQPYNVNVIVSKATCLKELNRNEDAIATYKTALNIDPKNPTAKTELFNLLKNTMPVEDVLDFLYKNVQNSPMNADAYYEFAYELHKSNKIDDAIVYYLQTIKFDNKKMDAYINLSQAYRQKKNYNDAYSIIKKAQQLYPENELVKKQFEIITKEYDANNYNLASNSFQSGNYQKAIAEYSKINPQTADSLLGIAACYQSLNDNAQAITYYQKAMELDKSNAELPFYIASIYANMNEIKKSKEYAEIALSKNPKHTQAKELIEYITTKESETLLADAVEKYDNKQYSDAITIFDKVLDLMPTNATVYYYRAMAFDAINNYEKAIADYKSTLKYAPDMTIAYYSLGVDYDAINNYPQAKINYQKYINLTMEDNDFKSYALSRINEIK